jgi:hypothetical protein
MATQGADGGLTFPITLRCASADYLLAKVKAPVVSRADPLARLKDLYGKVFSAFNELIKESGVTRTGTVTP